jgi:hypothetical protein
MSRNYWLPFLAAIGFVAAIVAVVLGNEAPPAAPAPLPSAQSPFDNYVAGTGLIEASTGNIAIGTPVSGIGIAEAALAVAKAQADQIDVDIERKVIRAPVDGRGNISF